jgi:hypothetical protein
VGRERALAAWVEERLAGGVPAALWKQAAEALLRIALADQLLGRRNRRRMPVHPLTACRNFYKNQPFLPPGSCSVRLLCDVPCIVPEARRTSKRDILFRGAGGSQASVGKEHLQRNRILLAELLRRKAAGGELNE